MELYRYESLDSLSVMDDRPSLTSKAGQGLCSSTGCDDAAAFVTRRGRRWWALCWAHAQLLAAGVDYWTPGLPIPEGSAEGLSP